MFLMYIHIHAYIFPIHARVCVYVCVFLMHIEMTNNYETSKSTPCTPAHLERPTRYACHSLGNTFFPKASALPLTQYIFPVPPHASLYLSIQVGPLDFDGLFCCNWHG